MTRPLALVLLSLAAASCGASSSSTACPTSGTTLSYANFGQAFMTSYCTACHGAGRTEAGVSLTTQPQVQARASQVAAAVSSGNMPPGGSPSPTSAEEAKLAEWLACGAP